MLWEEYYDKLGDWATSTAVSRMSQLESFGPSDQVADAINDISWNDEKGAARLLKKAIGAGVKFTGDQLSDFFLSCGEEAANRAVQFSSDQFGTEDLEALYGFSDEEVLISIAKKQKIPLPDSLADYAEIYSDDGEEAADPPLSPGELAAEYDYILDCLHQAHACLVQASKLSNTDTARKNRAATVLKYASLAQAEPYLEDAAAAWELLEFPGKNKHLLANISLNIGNSTMWQNYLFEGFFTNLMVKNRIRKITNAITYACKEIEKLRRKLSIHS